jgi:hypothetical protein
LRLLLLFLTRRYCQSAWLQRGLLRSNKIKLPGKPPNYFRVFTRSKESALIQTGNVGRSKLTTERQMVEDGKLKRAAKRDTLALLMFYSLTLAGGASAQMPATSGEQPRLTVRRMDFSKMTIERPAKQLIRTGELPARRPDLSKSVIESPIKKLISGGSPAEVFKTLENKSVRPVALKSVARTLQPQPRRASVVVAAGDKVAPGLVSWRKDVKEAMKCSEKSGKPVLVFHMMGMLDDRFC